MAPHFIHVEEGDLSKIFDPKDLDGFTSKSQNQDFNKARRKSISNQANPVDLAATLDSQKQKQEQKQKSDGDTDESEFDPKSKEVQQLAEGQKPS